MNPGTLLIRADATPEMGSGHVMRCLALAQGWREAGGNVVFAMALSTPAVNRRLAEENCRIVEMSVPAGSSDDIAATREVLRVELPSWVVLDGYHFDSAYREAIGRAGVRCMIVDDNGGPGNFSAELVVNQNVHADAALYPQQGRHTWLLLGPRYAMLRREFADRAGSARKVPDVSRKLLVTMGGSDPNEFAPRLLPSLIEGLDREVEIVVVVGGSASGSNAMKIKASSLPARVRVMQDVRNMAELMVWADLAIAAAGTTCWELCCMGLPSIVVEAAENQRLLARTLDTIGSAVNAGPVQDIDCDALAELTGKLLRDPLRRSELSHRAKKLVDGHGVRRVVTLMTAKLKTRAAEARDCRVLFEWANDPVVRAASFTPDPIPWESHQRWFEGQLGNAGARIFLFEGESGQPVGQVRYQIEGRRATLSVNVDPSLRGQGLGAKVLLLGVEEFFNTTSVDMIDAFVKPSNERSLMLFRTAGFEEKGVSQLRGQDAVWFVLQRWGTSK
ncbi:MAG: UDP-2,4-diacetamido-2,4,6-trideoxy-beta-L-altropyranose hydrolase [Acidobacteria bacterium]|nr:UDP-2,4-diacetamido-2,4,6-trideoxy-beta-L-altropyranose hydrolase [Acidobacteriota bacterium]